MHSLQLCVKRTKLQELSLNELHVVQKSEIVNDEGKVCVIELTDLSVFIEPDAPDMHSLRPLLEDKAALVYTECPEHSVVSSL